MLSGNVGAHRGRGRLHAGRGSIVQPATAAGAEGREPSVRPVRYDADQTVAAFAARLKDAVNLDSVQDDLASVVTKALEPAHVSVWMSKRG